MNTVQLDEAIGRWIRAQPGHEDASCRAQIKFTPGLVDMGQWTTIELP